MIKVYGYNESQIRKKKKKKSLKQWWGFASHCAAETKRVEISFYK
jgi:hypothetical protein